MRPKDLLRVEVENGGENQGEVHRLEHSRYMRGKRKTKQRATGRAIASRPLCHPCTKESLCVVGRLVSELHLCSGL